MAASTSAATKALSLEYKNLLEDPVEGFQIKLVDESDIFLWEVAIFGPPDTLYQGGYFKAHLLFPGDYPFSPPSIKFLSNVYHPNIYQSGELCISILDPQNKDDSSGEHPCERWNPSQTVRTILLSVVSLLNEPNIDSPANVGASVMYNNWKISQGEDKRYENIVREQVRASQEEAIKDKVVVPLTMEEYCINTMSRKSDTNEDVDITDINYDYDDYYNQDSTDGDADGDNEENYADEDNKNLLVV